MISNKVEKNDLFDYPNRYIYQMSDGFKFSIDSVLLAEFVTITNSDKNLLDMCTGNAPVPLILSINSSIDMYGFEIQPDIADLAKESVNLNNSNNIKIINDDIKNLDKYFKVEFFDLITCNPPYFKVNDESLINKNDYLSIARHEIKIKLDDIFELASKFLKKKGKFYLIHRAERLDDIIYLARVNNLNVKEIQLISTKEGQAPNTVIVKCIKGSSFGIKVRKEICIESLTTYQQIFK